MELSIQERLKDLRAERGLTLEQFAEQTHLSKSALGSYEADDFKDISHYALIKLAKFYGVTTHYLLGLSEMKRHPNADLADLRLSDGMIDLLKSGRAVKQVQSANAIVDAMSATIVKQHNLNISDHQLRQLIAAHIDDDNFCHYIIQQDINGIALDLREAHKDDFFSDSEKAFLVFICKRLRLNYGKLNGEDKAALKRLAGKSNLLKNPIPQRGRK